MTEQAPTVRLGKARPTRCPDDNELVAFAELALPDARRRLVAEHLDDCEVCRAAIGRTTGESTGLVRYRLDHELGRGGMGVVWRAWDLVLDRAVALKRLHSELDSPEFRARVLREARALARLDHPNVIAVYDAGVGDEGVFIATELIDGVTLEQWQRGRPAHEVVAAYAEAARGLHAAHQRGLIHRDIKPHNILVGRDGRVCVGDFGLAISRPVSAPAPSSLSEREPLAPITSVGALVGTPAYMAPEQRAGGTVDARADQYALCVSLAEALLGAAPELPLTAKRTRGIPAPWSAIARGLARDPADRHADLGPLIAALTDQPILSKRRVVVASLIGVRPVAKHARGERTGKPE